MPEDALFDYELLDRDGRRLGRIDGLWRDVDTGRPTFASVRTGWLPAVSRVVPLADARVLDDARAVQVPYAAEVVKRAPSHEAGEQIGVPEARAVWDHYLGAHEDVEIPLQGERLDVDRKVVETGGVRLRKVVRKEVVMQPCEVLREHVIVERLAPHELDEAERRAAGRDDEIVLRERGEVPVIDKHTEVVETIRARRVVETEASEIEVPRRVEDVEIEREAWDERR